jgi:hypothetical protein
MKLEDFELLPDDLSIEKIKKLFEKVIGIYDQNKIIGPEFLGILCELADRQVRTFELLDNALRNRIDKLLCRLWDITSYEKVDMILYIVVNLGLKECFLLAKKSIYQNEKISAIIKAEIESTIEEVGDNILNPYHTIENL